ncbi:glycosyltransferase [Flavihumibacter solisilvae]|uniref:Glycosyltransferase subfamily 4-like N-terminal domain-containing protein n=1 Tax=Flavihumibacter solisilvae TaxID=1349421 RepID=A0A0C1L0P5_9BACT|nr:glycosyltransferase [Flavihumibacter solisilvae]KIC93572.1 hypothetical protein OI18_17735 [Flavihumibacter solisilvae]
MKVLFVCSGNNRKVPVFIVQQEDELKKRGYEVDYFHVRGKGITGYLKNHFELTQTVKDGAYALIHGHYGLSGLLASFQRRLPVVVSYYGSDLNNPRVRIFSQLANKLSTAAIAVSPTLVNHLPNKDKCHLIPCAVDSMVFQPVPKQQAREKLQHSGRYYFEQGKKYVLFASRFDRPVKSPELAFATMKRLGDSFELIEFNNFSNEDVVLFFNAADALLLCSRTEGSPQVIKEAMACNRPIVSTDVGDVRSVISKTKGCFISKATPEHLAAALSEAVRFESTNGRDAIVMAYETNATTQRIIRVYEKAIRQFEIKNQ